MTSFDQAVRVVVAGWAVFLLMTVLVVAERGGDHLANMAVFAAIGAAMLAWVALRHSRASLVTSLVLGVLHTVEQIAYLVAGATADHPDGVQVAVDGVGLVSGLLLVAGSGAALSRLRKSPAATSPRSTSAADTL